MKKEQIGILQMVACAILWSTAGIFIKLLPWNGFAVASLRSLIAGITIAVYMGYKRYSFVFNRRTLLAGVLAGFTYVCFALANKLTTAANAIVLQFTAPVFILIYSGLFFRQKIRRADLAVVLIVLGGITLFFLDQLGPSTIAGNFVAIAAGMFMAGMYMTVGNVELHERFSAIVIGQAVAFLVGLPAVITTRPVMNPVTAGTILALGVLQDLSRSGLLSARGGGAAPQPSLGADLQRGTARGVRADGRYHRHHRHHSLVHLGRKAEGNPVICGYLRCGYETAD